MNTKKTKYKKLIYFIENINYKSTMDLPSNQGNPLAVCKTESSNLQIDDLNSLITVFKRREENIIQLMDLRIKCREAKTSEDKTLILQLSDQIREIELIRTEKEDQILLKYSNLSTADDKQKRLLERLISKVIQINVKVREKLAELTILQKVQESHQEIPYFHSTLKKCLKSSEVNVEILMTYIALTSRLRLLQGLSQEEIPSELQTQIKESFQELINFNNLRAVEKTKTFIRNQLWTKSPEESSNSETNSPESQPVTTYTFVSVTKTNRPLPIFTEYDNTKVEHTEPERSPAPSPLNNALSTETRSYAREAKQSDYDRKDKYGNRKFTKEVAEPTPPNFLIASQPREVFSNKDKMKNRRIRRSNFNERVTHTYDFNIQDSENPSLPQQFSSNERFLKIEAEGIKPNHNDFQVYPKQTYSHEYKTQSFSKPEVDSLQKTKKIVPRQRVRGNTLRQPTLNNKNLASSQVIESQTFDAATPETNARISPLKEDLLKSTEARNKGNNFDFLKNYDIMNAEYKSILTVKKKEAKAILVDRVFNELVELNFETKKTISKYFSDFSNSKLSNQIVEVDSEKTDPEPENLDLQDNSKKFWKNKLKQQQQQQQYDVVSRRSVSTDNGEVALNKRISNHSPPKAPQDLKTTRPPVMNNRVQQIQKIEPKLFVLPKLGLVDTNANKSSEPPADTSFTAGVRLPIKLKSINFTANPDNLSYPHFSKQSHFRKEHLRNSNVEKDFGEYPTPSMSHSSNEFNLERNINSEESDYCVDVEMPPEIFLSEKVDLKSIHQNQQKLIGYRPDYKTELPEIKMKNKRFSVDFYRNSSESPDYPRKLSPLKLFIHKKEINL